MSLNLSFIAKSRTPRCSLSAIYELALDATKEKSFDFLYGAANRYIKAKRLERNRERIATQAAVGMPSAPAPRKQVPEGFCIDFVQNGSHMQSTQL